MKIKNLLLIFFLLTVSSCFSFLAAYSYFKKGFAPTDLLKPASIQENKQKKLPLLKYSIENLSKLESSIDEPIKVKEIISVDAEKQLYVLLFTYQSQDKNISGALNIKITDQNSTEKMPVILMLRGYVASDGYYSGEGTKNAAAVFAENDYLTLAPDFLGYGSSDSEPNDTWEARFIKPLNVIDLIKTIEKFPEIDLSSITDSPIKKVNLDASKIGLWGHSNGGQIAVSTLEALGSNLPTTLWAPVLAPFPYSILYFTDENADEGKESRAYVSQFETDYDVFDFSLTKHLDRLYGPIQIQHGTNDDSALISWTEEFLAKIDLENERREANESVNAVNPNAAQTAIEIAFYKYQGANHNLQPNWDEAVQKDLAFFKKNLLNLNSL